MYLVVLYAIVYNRSINGEVLVDLKKKKDILKVKINCSMMNRIVQHLCYATNANESFFSPATTFFPPSSHQTLKFAFQLSLVNVMHFKDKLFLSMFQCDYLQWCL